MNAVAWLIAIVLFDLPFALVAWALVRSRRRHRALRQLVASYSHLPPGRVA